LPALEQPWCAATSTAFAATCSQTLHSRHLDSIRSWRHACWRMNCCHVLPSEVHVDVQHIQLQDLGLAAQQAAQAGLGAPLIRVHKLLRTQQQCCRASNALEIQQKQQPPCQSWCTSLGIEAYEHLDIGARLRPQVQDAVVVGALQCGMHCCSCKVAHHAMQPRSASDMSQ
jgi:hypothetical protein